MPSSVGPLLVVLGLAVVLVGVLAWTGALTWLGRLPGDLRWDRDGVSVHVPLTTMVLVSLVVSGLAWLVRRLG